jgi:hypothetical protein
MEIVNLIVAVVSLIVTAVAGIYIPLHIHKRDKDH